MSEVVFHERSFWLGAAAVAGMVEDLARQGKSAKHIALKIRPLQEAARSLQTEEAKER